MRIPSWLYRSERIGRNGKRFSLYKIRTLKEDFSGNYANEQGYTKYGKLLRKLKIDELPQVLNVLAGEMGIVGVRPELPEAIEIIPKEIRKILLSKKPGLTSLSSIHFSDEEFLLQMSDDQARDYHEKIKPLKIALDVFYIQNKNWLLDLAIIYMTAKLMLRRILK